MKQFKPWQAPLWAFFSTHFYRDLGSHGKGVGFVYLLCLLAISCGVESIKTGLYFYQKIETVGSYYAEQIPSMEIANGKLSMDQKPIYYVFDPESQQPVIAFDTRVEDGKKSPHELGVPVLVTSKNIIANFGRKEADLPFENEVLNFGSFNGMKMDKQGFMQMLRTCSLGVPFIDFALRLPPAWAWHIFQAFAYSVAGLILARMISINIKYEGILRIASFAVGNAIILGILAKFFPEEVAGVSLTNFGVHLGFLQMLVAFVYTLFGVSANLSAATFVSVEEEQKSQ